MILIDFSSIIHRMVHVSVSNAKPAKKDGKFVTSDFAGLLKYYILQDLFNVSQEHKANFGDIVICLDNGLGGYWRRDVYHAYKANRKPGRDESEIEYKEVFEDLAHLINELKNNVPWKVIDVPRAEADDIMLVLAREYGKYEKVLIHSPDKDLIQAQKDNEGVFQYSSLTKKWLVPENKHDHMEQWLQEHVVLGDAGDNVPKVVDHTEFSETFLEYLSKNGHEDINSPIKFKESNITKDARVQLLENFNVFKLNRKKESTGVKDVYKDIRFGPATLKKEITKHGSIEKWLDTHPMYRDHYKRNAVLVLEDGIPTDIWNESILQFKEAKTDYNDVAFEEYLKANNLKSILLELPNHFKINRDLTAADFGW